MPRISWNEEKSMPLKIQILLFSLLSGACFVPTVYAKSPSQTQNNEQSIVLNVQNMSCAMCKFTIKKALSSVEGTKQVSVNYEDKTAKVIFNSQKTNTGALIKAITNAGYPATVQFTKN
jgi:mercuric ion binding protein